MTVFYLLGNYVLVNKVDKSTSTP